VESAISSKNKKMTYKPKGRLEGIRIKSKREKYASIMTMADHGKIWKKENEKIRSLKEKRLTLWNKN